MRNRLIHCASLLTITLCLSGNIAQAQTRSTDQLGKRSSITDERVRSFDPLAFARPKRRAGFALMPSRSSANASWPAFNISPLAAAAISPVLGGGTVGRLTKLTGFTSSNSVIGDSTIFESKLGLVGIGTDSPTSRLTVAGLIESTIGGFKFPDGTVQATSASGALFSVAHNATLVGDGTTASPLGVAIPLLLSGSLPGTAVLGVLNSGGTGVDAQSSGGVTSAAVRGIHSANGFGVIGSSAIGIGILGGTDGLSAYQDDPAGVVGLGLTKAGVIGLSDLGIGVRGQSGSGRGVVGIGGNSDSQGGTGVDGTGGAADSQGGHGVNGQGGEGIGDLAIGGYGVVGTGGLSTNSSGGGGMLGIGGFSKDSKGGLGLQAEGGASLTGSGGDGLFSGRGSGPEGDGRAGVFVGNVEIDGDFNVTGTKNFKIDHPLDPANKYLYHAAVESSEVLNIYSGNVITDQKGDAVVSLPNWFEALNKEPRYQLTVIGTFAQAIVAGEIQDNRFTIKTNAPNVRVSWQVTGVRSDVGMSRHPFKAEQDKPGRERGAYLNPRAYGQPEERGVEWARNPELMRQMKERREQVKKQQQ